MTLKVFISYKTSFHGRNVLLLTSFCYMNCSNTSEKVCCCSMSLYHNIFFPSFCIFGRPLASMAFLQYILRAATSALCICRIGILNFSYEFFSNHIFTFCILVFLEDVRCCINWRGTSSSTRVDGLNHTTIHKYSKALTK